MTSIEWLQSKLPSLFENDDNGFYAEIFAQAKEMHKQENQPKKDSEDGKPYDWYNEDYAMEQFRKQLKQRQCNKQQ